MSSPSSFPPLPDDQGGFPAERPVESAFGPSPQPSPQPSPHPSPFLPPGGTPPTAPFTHPGPTPPPGQYPQQPAPYGYQPYAYGVPPPALQTNGMAVASMVLGIVGIFLFCLYAIPCIMAVTFAAISLNQFKTHPNTFSGRGMAIAGLVTGLVGIALLVLLIGAGNFRFWFD